MNAAHAKSAPGDAGIGRAGFRAGFRQLVLRFIRLRKSEKAEIVAELGLSAPEDRALPDLERSMASLRRARERGMLDALERAVSRLEMDAA